MSKPKPYNSKHDDLNLTQRWTKHLREKTKTTVTLTCPLCSHRPVFQTEKDLWDHVLLAHPLEIPKEDAMELEKFRARVILGANQGGGNARFGGNSTPKKELADLSRHEPLEPGEGHNKEDQAQNVSNPTSLSTNTLSQWQQIQAGTEQSIIQNISGIKDEDRSAEEPPTKKAGIGSGRSPSSSVSTAHSHDSVKRSKAQHPSSHIPFSPPITTSSVTPKETARADAQLSRPPTTGKRLFNPDTDLPLGQNLQSRQATNSRSRNVFNQPFKGRRLQQHDNQPQSSGRPQSAGAIQPTSHQIYTRNGGPGFQPGTIPLSLLSARPSIMDDVSLTSSETSRIVSQPETRPISQQQLVAEVKGIYAGLVMVESKCIQVNLKQAQLAREAPPGTSPKLNNDQWQALIALHRTLLHEHHDFFLASQHPSATPAVRRLAIKYAMPARLWRHGIHSFLELLRNRLPESLDHMLAFIYMAYSMMTLLYETVPAFEETWIECLGDLGRYRMAIEDDDIRDREVWTQVARQWYLKASNGSPGTGRLYHHLAILARPNALKQLFFYGKALSVDHPFLVGRESILTLFDPVLKVDQTHRRLPPIIAAFIKNHAILFTKSQLNTFDDTVNEFISTLDSHIGRATKKFLEQGYYMSIANCIALFEFGSSESILLKALASSDKEEKVDVVMNEPAFDFSATSPSFENSIRLNNQTLAIALSRIGDPNVLPMIHVSLVFMTHISRSWNVMKYLQTSFPWRSLVAMLNGLLRFYSKYDRIQSDIFPEPEKDDYHPLPEDYAMRGLFWTKGFWPTKWFSNPKIEVEEHFMEMESMISDRSERILWHGYQLAKVEKWICYSEKSHKFFLPGEILEDLSETEMESNTDSGTAMADCDPVGTSLGSRTTTWQSGKTDASTLATEISRIEDHTWESRDNESVDLMDVEEDSSQAPYQEEVIPHDPG